MNAAEFIECTRGVSAVKARSLPHNAHDQMTTGARVPLDGDLADARGRFTTS